MDVAQVTLPRSTLTSPALKRIVPCRSPIMTLASSLASSAANVVGSPKSCVGSRMTGAGAPLIALPWNGDRKSERVRGARRLSLGESDDGLAEVLAA
ncbi:hypothetical protein XACW160_80155 [Xanthomonas citri pv. citri]|uniref:Uncharacterized protein n=1 Tax=Xanthomonas citri pv. citri TaxID=611301 RepID=A0A0U5FJ49_XANCI|nr:hypothetical protein XAC3824_110160 [Xanthomonas citri pv. citri]CEJ44590.1 hypothetical protein XAB3213_270014 [Xanthomonas citri pv. bilvae]CEE16651.1 hypothetical protein XAC1083_100155 [Xanthomonas citri pv. citri]CEE17612.1 hypothetical protein XAC902_100159 [Xanthomonas citri pv. citri]CEE27325.1 hypothetical protein XAC908_140093 [Xanthomonas citri pv. citri]